MVTLFFVATARRAHIQMQVTIVKGRKKLQLGHAEQYLTEKLALQNKDPYVVHHR